MSLKVTQQNGISVYTVSGSNTSRSLPDWLARKRKRSLKTDEAWQNRIELIQDFEFEEASQCVRVSEDGEYAMATGTYKPQQHIYHLPSSALKYARHTSSLNLKFVLLSSDYTKSLHLQTDRSLEFHTAMGCHHTTRIPRYGRDLAYLKPQAQAVVAAEGRLVFRLDLEGGRFLRPFELGGYDGEEVTSGECVGVADGSHGLLAVGTDTGTTEFWDPRSRNRVGVLGRTPRSAVDYGGGGGAPAITAVEFSPAGLTLATGSSEGMVALYDLRSSNPLLVKDQGYGFPIKALRFLHSSGGRAARGAYELTGMPKVLSSDKRIVKIWDQESGKPWTSIEPSVDINDVCVVPGSGMIFTANEGREMHSFLIPSLGPSPWWCAHLDTQIEQLADKHLNDPDAYVSASGSNEVVTYDNYKFLTKSELKNLNLDHLIGGGVADQKKQAGGSLVRPYMHGYFVDQRLYDEATLIADPFEWERERKRIVGEKINKQRESRIRTATPKVKINKRLAERLTALEDRLARAKSRDAEAEVATQPDADSGGVLKDSRFNRLFQNPDFQVDEASLEFQQLNPSTRPTGKTAVEEEEEEDRPTLGSSSSSSSGEEDDAPRRQIKTQKKAPEMRISTSTYKKARHDTRGYPTTPSGRYRGRSGEASFGDRASLAASRPSPRGGKKAGGRGVVGEKEVTFFAGGGRKSGKGVQKNGGSRGRPAVERRSASGNVFRREGLGK